jgi:hypothetical protein
MLIGGVRAAGDRADRWRLRPAAEQLVDLLLRAPEFLEQTI